MSGSGQKRVKVFGGGVCPKCRVPMQRYEHAPGWRSRSQHSYFRWWDKCSRCRHLQHYEAARVFIGRSVA